MDADDDTTAWRQGPVTCTACGYSWIAVRPVATHLLECPRCQALAGMETVAAPRPPPPDTARLN